MTKTMKSKVSIIMPVLNGERYLGEAIDSILAQTYRHYELVAVDDGSTDRTPELLRQYGDRLQLRYVRHPVRQGIAASVNDGIRHSTGQYIAFLDHDDLWFPRFLETQVSYLEGHPDVGMVHSDFQTINSRGDVIEESVARCRNRKRPSGHVFRELLMDSFIAANSAVIRKECFDRLGGFDESIVWGDYHMWLRIARHYKIDYIPEVLTKYRQHSTQNTRDFDVQSADRKPVAVVAIEKILEAYPEVREELGEKTLRRRMANIYSGIGYYWLWKGIPRPARLYLRKAIRLWPTNRRFYISYGLSLLPPSLARAIQASWHRVFRMFSASGSVSEQYDARFDTGR
jgi:glycosyltransferase involved in cell wall biosynthesis